jgi:phasin family protein
VQALAAANRQVLYGVYAGLAQEGELLGRTIQQTLQCIENLSTSGSVNDLKESQINVLVEGIEAAFATMQEVAESIAAANKEALDILQQRLSERVHEIERIIEHTAE